MDSCSSRWPARWGLLCLLLLVACDPDEPSAPQQPDVPVDLPGVDIVPDANEEMTPDPDMTPDADMRPDEPCVDACAQGEQRCDGGGGYQVCGQYDDDACLELSETIACAQGSTCDAGRCASGCRDTCVIGATLCADEQTVQVCANFDQDACLEPGGDVACGAGERCEQGACVAQAAPCSDECAADGAAACFGDSVRACGQFDSDSCLDLGPPVACADGESCSGGVCAQGCQDSCPALGATECLNDGVRTCVASGACRAWSAPVACGGGESCSAGACQDTCADECPQPGQSLCSPDNMGVSVCGEFDSDSCLDRSTPTPCPGGFACDSGVCVPSCTDACALGSSRCAPDGRLETCGDFDADPCLEFGGAVSCPGGASCNNNACDLPCTDACPTAGATECTAGGVRTCGQYDLDACLEWSTSQACASFEVCQAGACELGATPAALIINELLYDAVGSDTVAGNTLFIELWGPPGQALDGWEIVGINGDGGALTHRVPLSGETIAQDGYFVIAHPQGDPALRALADITHPLIDFQNGPDSVQLVWRGRVVDALGYGTFSASNVFAGEGSPAPATGAGKSLSRDAQRADTDDNAADFVVLDNPTPRGMSQGCMDSCPSAGATQCSGQQLQTCGLFNGQACLSWSAPSACPQGGQVCQAGACAAPCSDECPSAGATQCLGTQIITCGNYDADACLEWSQAAACASGSLCAGVACQSLSAPEVVLISPQGTVQTTQGNTQRILVDPTPAGGRTIARVDFFANNMLIGSTTVAPHAVDYVVPMNTPTNSTITIRASAVDSLGEVGSSPLAYLSVRNDGPVASFTATITNATTVTVDASASTDTETAPGALEVCWDWDDDGTCETPWSTTKIQNHNFMASGVYTIRMKVRDAQGQIAETTRQISFSDIQYIGGTNISTTLWYGTIIITGDVVVPAGQTLTIAPGTQVLFVYADIAAPIGAGDYTITVQGQLIVNGTAAEPVIFSGQDAAAKVRGGWDRVVISGNTPSTIKHAIFEYGDVNLELRNATTLEDVVARQSRGACVLLNNADNATLTRLTVTQCGTDGLSLIAGSAGVVATQLTATDNGAAGVALNASSVMTATGARLAENGEDGARITASTLNLSESVVEDNTARGLHFIGNAQGQITRNQLRLNGAEGLGLYVSTAGSPNPVVNTNNIYSNAVLGATRLQSGDTTGLTLSKTNSVSQVTMSPGYTAPAGWKIRRVLVTYSATGTNTGASGQLMGPGNTSLISYSGSAGGGWFYTDPIDFVTLRLSNSSTGNRNHTISITSIELVRQDGSVEITSGVDTGTVDLRYNYLGTFPDVLSRVSSSSLSRLNLQGFTGVLYDPMSWDSGPYFGGRALNQVSWSGTVYVTGDLTIASGASMSVAPGTQILFVAHDQNDDGEGDFSITAQGAMDLNGALNNEVLIRPFGAPAGVAFQTITLQGVAANASAWQDVILTGAKIGLTLHGGAQLTRVEIKDSAQDNVAILAGTAASLSRLRSTGAMRHGVYVTGNATPLIEDSTIRDNQGHGVYVTGAAPSLNHNIITYNGGAGVMFEGASSGTSANNVLKFNDDVGILALVTTSGSPTPTFQYSNIYGNAVLGATRLQRESPANLTLMKTNSVSQVTMSPGYTAPAGWKIRRVLVTYSATGTNTGASGQLMGPGNTSLISYSGSSGGGWFYTDPIDFVTLRLSNSSTGNRNHTISINQIELIQTGSAGAHELSASTDTGTLTAKFNYWTAMIGDVPNRILQARAGSVDFTGFTGIESTTAGPRP